MAVCRKYPITYKRIHTVRDLSYYSAVRFRRANPLVNTSIHIPEKIENPLLEAQPHVQEYLNTFFDLRDSEEGRLRILAKRLLDDQIITESVDGVEICYKVEGRTFTYSFNKNFDESIYCPLAHQPLTRNKRINVTILTDAIAECETLVKLGYKPH